MDFWCSAEGGLLAAKATGLIGKEDFSEIKKSGSSPKKLE